MSHHKIIFIINPASGTRSKKKIAFLIENAINSDYEILFTKKPGHATEITKKAKNDGVDKVVAVGGDGTVNEIAKELINSNTTLGIIPLGSGNGLARELNISLNINKAIRLLNNCNISQIDSCTINGNPFFTTAGCGFDAHIASMFSKEKKRGFKTYFNIITSEFFKYKHQHYEIKIDLPIKQEVNGRQVSEKNIKRKAILISFANARQYGNNIFLSPQADIKDGLVDICILYPFPKSRIPELLFRLFTKTIHRFKYIEVIKAKQVTVKREQPGSVHLDGEPFEMGKELVVKVIPGSLKVLVPKIHYI